MTSLNDLPIELVSQILKYLPTRSDLFHLIQTHSLMNNTFHAWRPQILASVYSLELLYTCKSNSARNAVAQAQNTLQKLRVSKAGTKDAIYLANSALQSLHHDGIQQAILRPLADDLVDLCQEIGLSKEVIWQMISPHGVTLCLLPVGGDSVALYYELGRTDDALAVLERTWRTECTHNILRHHLVAGRDLATLYDHLGRTDEALGVLEKAWHTKDLQAVPPIGRDLAALYDRLGQATEALTVLEKMWQTSSHLREHDYLLVGRDLALLYGRLGQTNDTLAVLETMWEHLHVGQALPVGQDLAALYDQLGRTDMALKVLEKMWQGVCLRSLSSVGRDLALLYDRLGRMDEALVVLEKMWRAQSPNSIRLDLLPVGQDLAVLYDRLGRTDEALVVLERCSRQ